MGCCGLRVDDSRYIYPELPIGSFLHKGGVLDERNENKMLTHTDARGVAFGRLLRAQGTLAWRGVFVVWAWMASRLGFVAF